MGLKALQLAEHPRVHSKSKKMIQGLQVGTSLLQLLILCGLFIFFNSNSSLAQKQLEIITVKKEEYQLPVNVLEGYAESILFRKIAVDTIGFDWASLPYIKAEHRALIADKIRLGVNVKVFIKDLKMTEALHDNDNFYFKFEFSKPKTKSVTGYKIINEVKAETTNPLYKAPITFLLPPSFTKKVPIIDVRIHAPPIVKG